MSDNLEWAKIAASLVGGGLAGAALTNIITAYRGRIQPIGKRVDIVPLFTPGFTGSALRPTITVSDGASSYQFQNLHVADVSVVNRGNRDFTSFRFGLTFASDDACVHAEPTTSDRHHVATFTPTVTPANPARTVDFALQPFNRSDAYTFKLFIVAGGITPEAIQISSPEPVRFTDMPSIAETLTKIASSAAIKLGPFELSVPR
jgi:hypothetical protein